MDIPIDLLYIVASFHTKPRMKLLDWVDIDNLDWVFLTLNPNAIHLLEKYPEKIFWKELSKNPSIFETDVKQTHIHIKKKASKIDYVHL